MVSGKENVGPSINKPPIDSKLIEQRMIGLVLAECTFIG